MNASDFAAFSAQGASAAETVLRRAPALRTRVQRALLLSGVLVSAGAPLTAAAHAQENTPTYSVTSAATVAEQPAAAETAVVGVPMRGHFSVADEMPLPATVTVLERGIEVDFGGVRPTLLLPHRVDRGMSSPGQRDDGDLESFDLSMGRFLAEDGAPLREFADGIGTRFFPAEESRDLLSQGLVEGTGKTSGELLEEALDSKRVQAALEVLGSPKDIRLGEAALYVPSEQAVEVDPAVMPDMRSLENTLVHEIAHHWQATRPDQHEALESASRGMVPMAGAYGEYRGERDKSEASAQELMAAIDFLVTLEDGEATDAEMESTRRALLHQYPGAAGVTEMLLTHPRFENHPLRQQDTSREERAAAEHVPTSRAGISDEASLAEGVLHQHRRLTALLDTVGSEPSVAHSHDPVVRTPVPGSGRRR